jgi:hypothetical protein
MDTTLLIQDLNGYGWELREGLTLAALETLLAEKFNVLIGKDFSALVQFLYRMDISETRLKQLLKENAGEEAGRIIARMVIERQLQKMETRRLYSSGHQKGERDWEDV